ncbi:MAG: aldo/keto reductase [Hyphomicrobiaceae bacterium]|nr:aldo/keto reductase [Hyphomicrobiaceae bacterium]
MQKRVFGRSGLQISVLGFGCGAVGGLMVRGDAAEQERTIARALEAGVNYFDTAALYGQGASETNLGRVLRTLRPKDCIVGTKVRLEAADAARIGPAIEASLEASLRRLGMEQVDILHLHNTIRSSGGGDTLTAKQVLEEVVPALATLRQKGKVRLLGVTAVGDTPALHEAIGAGVFDSAQVVYNLLNPSAGGPAPASLPGQDYGNLLARCAAAGTGVVGIRVLAGGTLSGSAERHPIASPPPAPIGSAARYDDDLRNARRFLPLIECGEAASLAEAATRYAISNSDIGTILVGMATFEQFEQSLAAVLKGPLSPAALARVAQLQAG